MVLSSMNLVTQRKPKSKNANIAQIFPDTSEKFFNYGTLAVISGAVNSSKEKTHAQEASHRKKIIMVRMK